MRVEATFRGRLADFTDVRVWAEAFGATVGCDRDAVLRLVLVLEELFTNTVTHGYAGDDRGPIRVALASRGGNVEVTYEDAGPAFDPFDPRAGAPPTLPPLSGAPGGLGLALVRGLAVAPRYVRVDERNRITLTVPPQDPPAAPPAGPD
jgi:serine/threonine-protein kinase RsbW